MRMHSIRECGESNDAETRIVYNALATSASVMSSILNNLNKHIIYMLLSFCNSVFE